MDIDEFLDKELQLEKEVPKKKHGDTQISEEDKDTIKHYFELWDKVSEAEFRWDNDLYAELDNATNKIKEKLSTLLSEKKREKSIIGQLISKATNELENRNYEAATKLFSEISDIRKTFPDFLLEEKKDLNKEIVLLYEKLHDQIDSKFIRDLKASIAEVDSLISSSYSSLDAKDIDKAKILYEKALRIYKHLPNGFLSKKIELGTGLLRLYKDLSIHTQIKDLQQQLDKKFAMSYKHVSSDQHLQRLSELIKQGNFKKAPESSVFSKLKTITKEKQTVQNKKRLSKMIARKLERAKTSLKKKNYLEVKKDIDAILKVDPNNKEAKKIMDKIAVKK